MKKLVMTAAVLACAASIVSAQTVTSANIVGYSKVEAVGGQLTLVAVNFDAGEQGLADIVGDLDTGSALYLWDKSSNGYITVNKNRGGWDSNPSVDLGDAFWISPAGSATNEIIINGEVLVAATNTVAIETGLEATGFYYPVDILLQDTGLADALNTGDAIYIWNGTGYTTANKNRGGWDSNPTLGTSGGFWVSAGSPATWEEVRPFNLED